MTTPVVQRKMSDLIRSESMANLDIECPICRDTYTRPRFLRCYHSFCTACLQQLLNSQHDRNILKCPLRCQTLTMVPSGGINALAIDHFKCNLIEQLFEVRTISYLSVAHVISGPYSSYDMLNPTQAYVI